MGIGTSIFLIAVGAILRWGISDSIEGVNLPVIGLILIVVGIIGLAISLLWANVWSRRGAPPDGPIVREREPY
jgi:hypothetical protein